MARLSLAPRPPSAVTRSIYLGTLAAIAVVATLSVVIYRSAVDDAVAQNANQQLAMVRTAAVAIEAEIRAQTTQLRQFASLPSVQNLDLDVLSQRVGAAFGENASGLINVIVRADVDGRRYIWTPQGELTSAGSGNRTEQAVLQWAANRANANQVRMYHGWENSVPSRRALVMPVWRTAPAETLLDEDLMALDELWAAAGTPRAVFPLTPAQLAERTGGRVTRVSPAS